MILWLLSPLGRIVGTAAIAGLAWLAFAKHYEHKGASRVTARMEQKVAEHAETAEAARRSVSGLPVDRLRDKWTRD
jgi:hypothetical protein